MIITIGALAAPAATPAAAVGAAGDADVAALQVALRAAGAYSGTVDGWRGPGDGEGAPCLPGAHGPRARRHRGPADETRARSARPAGARVRGRSRSAPAAGTSPSSSSSSPGTAFRRGRSTAPSARACEAAVRRFQRFADLPTIGIAGPRTMAALGRPLPTSPLELSAPVAAPVGDGFGPRGDAFHAGVDFVAPAGTPVVSARAGRVVWAAALGSFGNTVVVRHGRGVRTLYAHLSRIDVEPARPRVDGHASRPRGLDRARRRDRTCTSRYACAAPPSTRSARSTSSAACRGGRRGRASARAAP